MNRVNPGEIVFESGTGFITVVPEGGRISQLRPTIDLPNLLCWDLGLSVFGGDRLWLSPELDIFQEDPSDPSTWRIPPELDPGAWTAEAGEDSAVLRESALGAHLSRHVRSVKQLPVACDLPWSGYVVTDRVHTQRPWSVWHLVMVPTPADVYCSGRNPVTYYAPAPAPSEGWVHASGQPPRWKLGLDPAESGRVFLAAVGQQDPGGMVVVASSADPSGTYVDRPPSGERACPVQVFNSPGLGFCELEHHSSLENRALESMVLGVWGSLSLRLELLTRLRDCTAHLPGLGS